MSTYNKTFNSAKRKEIFGIREFDKENGLYGHLMFVTADLKILYDFLQPQHRNKKKRKILSDEHGSFIINTVTFFLFFQEKK